MDETHENETSAKITNSETKKLKIVTSLSNLITFVFKMLTTEIGDMNNNKEVDTMKIANIQAKDMNLSAPEKVELLNKHADVTAYPLGFDDVPHSCTKTTNITRLGESATIKFVFSLLSLLFTNAQLIGKEQQECKCVRLDTRHSARR